MPRTLPSSTTPPASAPDSSLDALPLYLPRAYYSLLGLLERELTRAGLDRHLAPGMGHILLHLYEHDGCIIKEIGERVLIANGTLTGLLRRMQDASLIECRRCARDGRATRVRLTPLARSLESKLRLFHDRIVATVQRDLTDTEVQIAKLVLGKIIQSLRSADADLALESTSGKPGTRKLAKRK